MFSLYYLYYILGFVMIPGIILGIWAQTRVKTTFDKYKNEQTKHGMPAQKVARYMLDAGGCINTKIQPIAGELTDNYNSKTDTISLSQSVYDQATISAVGVTAHEIGHVFQHKQGYGPIKLRNFLVPVMNVLSWFVWPLIIIGLVLEIAFSVTGADILIYIALGFYALDTVFCLITLPIELNASKRAYKMLTSTGEMDLEEANKMKEVLNAAAWTYVAALITSVLSLLRLVLFIFAIKGKD